MPTEYVEMIQSDPGDEQPDPTEQGPDESLEDVRDRLHIQ